MPPRSVAAVGTRIWDRPDAHKFLTLASGQLSPTSRVVTATLHFTSYLVVDGEVIYTVHWIARARWDLGVHSSLDQVPVESSFVSGKRGGSLTANERAALAGEYPDQDVLP